MDVFNGDSLKWSRIKDMDYALVYTRNTITLGEKLVVFSGDDNKIRQFDPYTENWNIIADWPASAGNNQWPLGILYNNY